VTKDSPARDRHRRSADGGARRAAAARRLITAAGAAVRSASSSAIPMWHCWSCPDGCSAGLAFSGINRTNVLRFAPPLIATDAQVDRAAEAFGEAVVEARALVAEVAQGQASK
jgi:adenosylmethionine-8-amino-7-oxononanoate aminotransferase